MEVPSSFIFNGLILRFVIISKYIFLLFILHCHPSLFWSQHNLSFWDFTIGIHFNLNSINFHKVVIRLLSLIYSLIFFDTEVKFFCYPLSLAVLYSFKNVYSSLKVRSRSCHFFNVNDPLVTTLEYSTFARSVHQSSYASKATLAITLLTVTPSLSVLYYYIIPNYLFIQLYNFRSIFR